MDGVVWDWPLFFLLPTVHTAMPQSAPNYAYIILYCTYCSSAMLYYNKSNICPPTTSAPKYAMMVVYDIIILYLL